MQRYKVFINDHFISCVEKFESNQQSKSVLCLKFNDESEFKTLVEWLFNEQETMHVYILTDQPKETWEKLVGTFNLIKAAGGVVKNEQGQLLLIKRLGKWDLPKGKIEKGETSEENALREVEEECGLDELEVLEALDPSYHMYKLGKEIIIKKTDWYKMRSTNNKALVPQTEEDIEEVKWVNPSEVDKLAKQTYASLKPTLLNAVK